MLPCVCIENIQVIFFKKDFDDMKLALRMLAMEGLVILQFPLITENAFMFLRLHVEFDNFPWLSSIYIRMHCSWQRFSTLSFVCLLRLASWDDRYLE